MRGEWTDELPPPSPEVYELLEEATSMGYWLKWARYAYHASKQGGRYKVTHANSESVLLVCDDLDTVRQWLRGQAVAA